jgi:hypothetical protein
MPGGEAGDQRIQQGMLRWNARSRDLRERLEDMEATQRRGADAGEFSDPEIEEEAGHD